MADERLVFYGITITDWLQGIGSLIGIIGGLWAVITLFRKDKDKQLQIDSLGKIAEQSEQHTRQLIYQVEQHRKSTSLLQEQVDIFRKSLELTVEVEDAKRKEEKIKKAQRAIDIQPNFEVFLPDKELIDRDTTLTFPLVNRGEKGKVVEIIELNGNNAKPNDASRNVFIDTGRILRLSFQAKQFGLTMLQVNTHVSLIIEDKDGNQHYQEIHGKGKNLNISQPKIFKDPN